MYTLGLKKVKTAELSEAETNQLIALNNQNVGKNSGKAKDLQGVCERFKPEDVVWILLFDEKQENEVIGSISIYPEIDPKHCFIVSMFVNKKYRKKGLSKVLIQKCHEYCVKEYKITKLCGFVHKNDKKFIGFWTHIGSGTKEHLLTPAPSSPMHEFPKSPVVQRRDDEIYYIHDFEGEGCKFEMPESVEKLNEI